MVSLLTGMGRRVEVARIQVGLPVASDLQEEEPEEAPEEDLAVVGHLALDPRAGVVLMDLLDLLDLQGETGGGDRRVLQMMMETAPMKTSILEIANSPETSRRP